MIQLLTLRIIDYVIVGISGACFLIFIACGLYAIPWNRERRKQIPTKDFNVFWKTRLCLGLASALWLLLQWLRLMALWQPGSQLFPSNVTSWTGGGQLCRLYITLSIGILEPFCIFTAVLLCRSVLSKRRLKAAGWPNAWVLALAFLMSLPFLAAQTVISWLSDIIPGHQWERRRDIGSYFLAPYIVGTAQECQQTSSARTCLLCFFPATSTIAAAIPGVLAALLLWLTIRRMVGSVINRRIRCRLRAFLWLMIIGLFALNALRATTLAKGTPFSWVFEMLWLAYFLSIVFLVCVYTLFLVIIPVRQTVKASKDIQRVKRQELHPTPEASDSKRRRLQDPPQLEPSRAPQTKSETLEETLLTVRDGVDS